MNGTASALSDDDDGEEEGSRNGETLDSALCMKVAAEALGSELARSGCSPLPDAAMFESRLARSAMIVDRSVGALARGQPFLSSCCRLQSQ